MPFGVPIFGVSLFNCWQFFPIALRNNLIGDGGYAPGKVERHCSDDPDFVQVKKLSE